MRCYLLLFVTVFLFALPFAQAADSPIPQIDTGGHSGLIRDIAVTRDGRYLVSASDDKVIRVWDIDSGETVRTLRWQMGSGSEGKIYAMALSADNRLLAMAGEFYDKQLESGTICVYDFASGRMVSLLKGHTYTVQSLAFSPDNRWLVSGSSDQNAILWDVNRKQLLHTLYGHEDMINAVAFTPDSRRVVTGSDDHNLKLWRVANGSLINTLEGHTDGVSAVAVSPDNQIVSGSWDHNIRVWDGNNGAFRRTLVADQGTEIGALSISQDGQLVLSGAAGYYPPWYPYLYHLSDGQRLLRYEGHGNTIGATAFSPDGRWAATADSEDNSIHLWSVTDGHLLKKFMGVGSIIWAVGIIPSGDAIAWGKSEDWKNTNHRGPLQYQLRLPNAIKSLGRPQPVNEENRFHRAVSRQGEWELHRRIGGQHGLYAIIDIRRQGKTQYSIERDNRHGYDHLAYTFTPAGQHIISGGSLGHLTRYTLQGEPRGEFSGHTGDIFSVAVSADGRLLVSGSSDQTVRVWSIDTQELLLTLFQGTDGQWVTWTPQGYYASSVYGDQMIGWQINRGANETPDYVKAAQMHKHFYRPDIVDDALLLGSAHEAITRADNTNFNLEDLITLPPPKFIITDVQYQKTAGQPIAQIALDVEGHSRVDEYLVYVDGRLVSQLTTRSTRTQASSKIIEVPVANDSNVVRIVAKNTSGETVGERALFVPERVKSKVERKGDLYIVSIGVSQYPFLKQQLKYATTDAEKFHQVIKRASSQSYEQIHEWLLNDDSDTLPTRNNIKNVLKALQNAKAEDTAIVFLAGHGKLIGKDYYFLPMDSQLHENRLVTNTAVKWQLIQSTLDTVKGRRVLIADTCYSKSAYNPRLIKDANDVQIAVFSATDDSYAALELHDYGYGALSYALIQGIKGAADSPRRPDQKITLVELKRFVDEEVPFLTKNRQYPRVYVSEKAERHVIAETAASK